MTKVMEGIIRQQMQEIADLEAENAELELRLIDAYKKQRELSDRCAFLEGGLGEGTAAEVMAYYSLADGNGRRSVEDMIAYYSKSESRRERRLAGKLAELLAAVDAAARQIGVLYSEYEIVVKDRDAAESENSMLGEELKKVRRERDEARRWAARLYRVAKQAREAILDLGHSTCYAYEYETANWRRYLGANMLDAYDALGKTLGGSDADTQG